MENNNEKSMFLNSEQLNNVVKTQQTVILDLELILELIKFLPDVKNKKVQEEPLYHYGRVTEALSTMSNKLEETLNSINEVNSFLHKEIPDLNDIIMSDDWSF